MSLNAALSLFIQEYANARGTIFAKNAVADFIRKDIPEVIRETLGPNQRYVVEGSPGQGVWAGCLGPLYLIASLLRARKMAITLFIY